MVTASCRRLCFAASRFSISGGTRARRFPGRALNAATFHVCAEGVKMLALSPSRPIAKGRNKGDVRGKQRFDGVLVRDVAERWSGDGVIDLGVA